MNVKFRNKYRYVICAAIGIIFFTVYGLWYILVPASQMHAIEPIVIMILAGFSLFFSSWMLERNTDKSAYRRIALVFMTISICWLPLYLVKAIISGEIILGYPVSVLLILECCLLLVVLIMAVNLLESHIYAGTEIRKAPSIGYQQWAADLFDISGQDPDDESCPGEVFRPGVMYGILDWNEVKYENLK
jgi:hypothetical protein